jgi:hypothetical protein
MPLEQQLRTLEALVIVTRCECQAVGRALYSGYQERRFHALRTELAQWHRLRNQVLQELPS